MRNKDEMINTTMGMVGSPGFLMANPSTAEEMVMAGVIIPSASKVLAPMMAGMISHFARFRTSENKDNIPPSPLLSAFKTINTDLMVVCNVSVQNIQDSPPYIMSS